MTSDANILRYETRLLAFGEVLWDMLPTGAKLGGAPVNFLYHARLLGAKTQAFTKIGDDRLGRDILARLKELDVPADFVQIDPNAPTGVVRVTLDASGTPSYEIVEGVAWDAIDAGDDVCRSAVEYLSGSRKSAFYFGSLALRSEKNRESFERIVKECPASILKVCDLNLRSPFYSREIIERTLDVADVYKLNDIEAIRLDAMFNDVEPSSLQGLADSTGGFSADLMADAKRKVDPILADWAERWRRRFGLQKIIVTCGPNGAYIFGERSFAYADPIKVDVKDTVGAGDAFSAVAIVGILQDYDLEVVARGAAKRAAFVCSQEGATPVVPAEALNPYQPQ